MKTMIFDIETIPASVPEKGMVLSYLYDKKVKKAALRHKECDDKTEEEFIRNTSFDGGFGHVLCIAFAINDGEIRVIYNKDNEKKTLEDFWTMCVGIDLFVGHNIMDFDFKFLYQRSIVLGVKPTRDLNFARYRNSPIYDTMKEWVKWSNDVKSLEHVALALGLPSPKDGIDGSEVAAFHEAGKDKEICEYCKRDVETTREIYKRMNFSD